LDPLLIPQFIEVVIGECLFELQFRVEENMDSDSLVPVDMDDLSGERTKISWINLTKIRLLAI
jgi:hypothetical protein